MSSLLHSPASVHSDPTPFFSPRAEWLANFDRAYEAGYQLGLRGDPACYGRNYCHSEMANHLRGHVAGLKRRADQLDEMFAQDVMFADAIASLTDRDVYPTGCIS